MLCKAVILRTIQQPARIFLKSSVHCLCHDNQIRSPKLNLYLYSQVEASSTNPRFCANRFAVGKRHLSLTNSLAKSKKGKTKKLPVVLRAADAAEFVDLEQVQDDMKAIVDELKEEYAYRIRMTADVTLFEHIRIKLDGEEYFLNEVAEISQENPRLIFVDMVSYPEYLKEAERVIRDHEMNLNPLVDGTRLKVTLPHVTREQEKNCVNRAKSCLNQSKERVRRVRDDVAKSLQKVDKLSKTLERKIGEQVDLYVKQYFIEMDNVFDAKCKNLKIS